MAELVQSSDSSKSSDSEGERKRKRHRKKGKKSKHGHKKRSVLSVHPSVSCLPLVQLLRYPTFLGARSAGERCRVRPTLRVREERRGCG